MKVKSTTKTIKVKEYEFNFTLTHAQLLEAQADPAAFVAQMAGAVNGANGHKGRQKTEGPARGRKQARPNGKSAGLEYTKCPECDMPIAAKFLPRHRKAKHGVESKGKQAEERRPPRTFETAVCPECGKEIATKYMANHRLKKHGAEAVPAAQETTAPAAA